MFLRNLRTAAPAHRAGENVNLFIAGFTHRKTSGYPGETKRTFTGINEIEQAIQDFHFTGLHSADNMTHDRGFLKNSTLS